MKHVNNLTNIDLTNNETTSQQLHMSTSKESTAGNSLFSLNKCKSYNGTESINLGIKAKCRARITQKYQKGSIEVRPGKP